MTEPKISILLPSRGRTDMLDRSIDSLIDNADDPASLQFLMGFDDDDQSSIQHFIKVIAPKIDAAGAVYTTFEFKRLGYQNLHRYLNSLAPHARASWWVFWNDDAVMLDSGWDTTILAQGDKFCIQAFDTHNLHPYSIFPIVPKAWFDLLGHLSQHPLNDAYISQIAWMLDIMVRIPIRVEHDRFDLTGNNADSTFAARNLRQLEGNISNPTDFNHESCRYQRILDAEKIVQYLTPLGFDANNWEQIKLGKVDPWTKMLASDVNDQMKRVTK